MKKIVAVVKLVRGNRGYFDPSTGINLSVSNNIGYVREDDDTTNIRKAIRDRKIQIVGGQLPPTVDIKQKPVKEKKVAKKPVIIKEVKKEEKIEPKVEEKKEEKKTVVFQKTERKDKKKLPAPVKEEVKALPAEVKEEEKKEVKEEQVKDGE